MSISFILLLFAKLAMSSNFELLPKNIENLGKFFGQRHFLSSCTIAVFKEKFLSMKHLPVLRLNEKIKLSKQINKEYGKCFIFIASSKNWRSSTPYLEEMIHFFQTQPLFTIKLHYYDTDDETLNEENDLLFPVINVNSKEVSRLKLCFKLFYHYHKHKIISENFQNELPVFN